MCASSPPPGAWRLLTHIARFHITQRWRLLFILCLGRCSQTAMRPPLTRSSPKSFSLGEINIIKPPSSTHTHKVLFQVSWEEATVQGCSLVNAALISYVLEYVCACSWSSCVSVLCACVCLCDIQYVGHQAEIRFCDLQTYRQNILYHMTHMSDIILLIDLYMHCAMCVWKMCTCT